MTNPDANKIEVDWTKLDQEFSGLSTGKTHVIGVKREAIPLVFVPGIMGSMLRLTGTDGEGDNANGLPNMRWNPSSTFQSWKVFSGLSGGRRRELLVGEDFDPNFLEVHDTDPVGNGFQGVSSTFYHPFLEFLQQADRFGPLNKVFDFPVYAVGYNWTDSNVNNGKKLATRIDEIIEEAKTTTGQCEKVILLSHSMGGLVTRYASEAAGANSKVLGIIHGVQPAVGAAVAYWRIKAGFEADGLISKIASRVLGNSGPTVTPILGNMPGGLELLPNKDYLDPDGSPQWLRVEYEGKSLLAAPKADPYKEIYRRPATGNEVNHPDRDYWGLVDPDLLNPDLITGGTSAKDLAAAAADTDTPWDLYLCYIEQAEAFHNTLGTKTHSDTYTFHGTGHDTICNVLMEVESVWIERNSYVKRGFRGRFNSNGEKWRAWLQKPTADGDGTVSIFSATSLDADAQQRPAPIGVDAEHSKAYDNAEAREFSVTAIAALCEKYYKQKLGK